MIARVLVVAGVLVLGNAAWAEEAKPAPVTPKPGVKKPSIWDMPSGSADSVVAPKPAKELGKPTAPPIQRRSLFDQSATATPVQEKAKNDTGSRSAPALSRETPPIQAKPTTAIAASASMNNSQILVSLGMAPAPKETGDLAGNGINASNTWSRPWRLGIAYEQTLAMPMAEKELLFIGIETGLMRMTGNEARTEPTFGNRYSYDYKMLVVPLTLHAGWRAEIGDNLLADIGPFAGAGWVRSAVDSTMTTGNRNYGSTGSASGRYTEFGLRAAAWWRWDSLVAGVDARWQVARTGVTYEVSETRDGVTTLNSEVRQTVTLNGLAIALSVGLRF